MAISYPTSLDTFTNPTSGDPLDSPAHSTQHANVNDGVEALEAKVGIDSSTPTDNTVLRGTGTGNSNWGQIDVGDIGAATLSGSDTTLITGTAGTTEYTAKWNADGDLVDGFEVLDEDTMSSDSATKLATQQSIKAYVDTKGDIVTMTTYSPRGLSVGYDIGINSNNKNDNTRMDISLVTLPFKITVNKISIDVTAAGVSGTLNLMVYAEDGQTRYINETTSSISGAGVHTHSLGTPVDLEPGLYWIACSINSTGNLTIRSFEANGSDAMWDGVSGEYDYHGNVTITADTPPTTFTPITTGGTVGCCVFRFD